MTFDELSIGDTFKITSSDFAKGRVYQKTARRTYFQIYPAQDIFCGMAIKPRAGQNPTVEISKVPA